MIFLGILGYINKIENKNIQTYMYYILIYFLYNKLNKMLKTAFNNYSNNEINVYHNKSQEVFEEAILDSLNREYNELNELIQLFSCNANDKSVERLYEKQKIFDKTYKPAIKEQKRLLKNTKQRFKYHINRCE